MGRKVDEVIAGLPKARRARIDKRASAMAGEMIAYADSLGVVRRSMSKTQVEIGEDLGLGQNAISQLEQRSDILLSTLRRYVRALGAELELVVRTKGGASIVLERLGEAASRTEGSRDTGPGRPARTATKSTRSKGGSAPKSRNQA